MAAVFAGAGSVTAMAETADAATVETQAESQAAKPALTEFAHITSCEVTGGNQVSIKGQMEGSWSDPAYYDNYLYLFEMKPYQRDLKGRTDYAAWITKGDELSFQLPLNHGTQEDRLYSSFVVAVYDGSEYTIVSNEAYVANPESVAKYTDPYKTAQTKKGLLIQTTPAMLSDAFSLGVNHVIVNIPFNHILGSGIDYEYDGKTYHFNKDVLAVYDDTIKRMSEKDMTVTAVILNGWNDSTPQLYYPGVTKQPASVATYYGFHVATEEGYESLRAIAAFLADRYGSKSSPYGRVSNWVIGNEINDGQAWNYIGQMDIDTYCSNYATGFRTWYDTIKGSNKLANVYIPFDFRWNCGQVEGFKYGAMDMIPRLNSRLKDTDYGIAWHAYPETFEDPVFSDDKYTLEKADTYIINLKNLHILTDYMQQADMLSPSGKVRHLILSEQGFTSDSPVHGGQCLDLQAQCIKEAYETAKANPYVEAFLLNRMKDEQGLLGAHYAFGLIDVNGNKKPSFEVYKTLQ